MSPYRRVLVTGGAGFIGSHLVDALLARGSVLTVLDDLSTGKAANLAAHAGREDFRLVRASILDTELVDRLVAEHEIVYHLAAAVGVKNIVADPLHAFLTNVRGTENVLAAAYRYQTPVLLASTSEIYGKSTAWPFKEDGVRVLGPTWIHRWSYSTAKAVDEHLAFAYSEKGLPMSIVRYFNSYGPRIDERGYGSVIARFAAQALAGQPITVHGDGKQSRCFTYVTDTVRGTILASEADVARGRVVNIGTQEELTIDELAHLVRELVGSASPIRYVPYESEYGLGFEDTRRRIPDVTLARELLSFAPEVPLRQGLAWTLEWCRENFAVAAGDS